MCWLMVILVPGCTESAFDAASHPWISVSRMKHVEKPFLVTVCLNCFFSCFFILKLMVSRARTWVHHKLVSEAE